MKIYFHVTSYRNFKLFMDAKNDIKIANCLCVGLFMQLD